MGQKSISNIAVKNKGGHAGFWVLSEAEAPRSQELKPHDFDQVGTKLISPFAITPDKFYLRKGETVNLEIVFDPANEGKFNRKFYLGCDNLKVYEYTIAAESNMIELKPMSLNGTALTDECLPLQEIHFRDVELKNPVVKTFEIENLTKNKINYEWRIQDPNKQFVITPSAGIYQERERKTTSVEFVAGMLEACYATVSLVIKDIPLESVRNPPQRILEMIRLLNSMTEAERKTQKVEFVYFSMTLFGEVSPLRYSVSPEFFTNPAVMPIQRREEARYSIKNHSKCASKFVIKLVGKSSEHLHTNVRGVYKSLELAKVMELYKSDDEVVCEIHSGRKETKTNDLQRTSELRLEAQESSEATEDWADCCARTSRP